MVAEAVAHAVIAMATKNKSDNNNIFYLTRLFYVVFVTKDLIRFLLTAHWFISYIVCLGIQPAIVPGGIRE